MHDNLCNPKVSPEFNKTLEKVHWAGKALDPLMRHVQQLTGYLAQLDSLLHKYHSSRLALEDTLNGRLPCLLKYQSPLPSMWVAVTLLDAMSDAYYVHSDLQPETPLRI